jgi:hypothetical protein
MKAPYIQIEINDKLTGQIVMFMAESLKPILEGKVVRQDQKLDAGYSVSLYKVGDTVIRMDIKLPKQEKT